MKKIKIMLTAMIVLGTVGGVLAFKQKRSVHYCTTATQNGVCLSNASCPGGTIRRIADGSITKCYVQTMDSANCVTDKPACDLTARLTVE